MRTDHAITPYAGRTLDSGGKQIFHKRTGTEDQIVVRGELSRRFATAFEGMETGGGQTVLTGKVKDQSFPHGNLPG